MPSFFLTVRFPVTPLTGDHHKSPDAPPSSHEEPADVFYMTDTQIVAEKLLEMFRHKQSSETRPLQFDLVSGTDIALPQRVEFRHSVRRLAFMGSFGFDHGVCEDAGLPHDKKTDRLARLYHKASGLEPCVREDIEMNAQSTEQPLETALTSEAKLAALEKETPEWDPDSGDWVRNTAAAKTEGVTTETLKHYRADGSRTGDTRFGVDPHGRIWRRPGTSHSHPWYLVSTLKAKSKRAQS